MENGLDILNLCGRALIQRPWVHDTPSSCHLYIRALVKLSNKPAVLGSKETLTTEALVFANRTLHS
jgi:hypothetical protein